ncbi:MAG: flagellar hook-associated protein FlgK [Candidatus Faecalibacterium intestinavium]|uniref:Flagellar hook-associated protein 1 n=1 Tax=Candidatus Faecalibacterium intestinavium TaxID=2838580 RepID=A0A9E2KJW1_9FIRM|nr:flagellar hook-associated protein FlgK [Candidatus Faecalibacterium intestinavium]
MGTFGSFTTVRLGIYSAQKGLDVTGNNITNINTVGYTRQQLKQASLIPSVSDRYVSIYSARIGQGAVVSGITQLRDPGLDISYRKAQSDVGSYDAKLEGLNDLATILDEVGKGSLEQDDGVILSQLNDLRDLISESITNGTDNTLIRTSAEELTTLFNSYATKLSELKTTYEEKLDQEVDQINDILTQIRDLNEAIRNSDLRGDPGLELRDQRNVLLDELSSYIKLDIKYSMESVGPNTEIEKLTVSIAGTNTKLVDGVYSTQLATEDAAAGEGRYLSRNPNFNPTEAISDKNRPYFKPDGTTTSNPDHAAKIENTNYSIVLSPLANKAGEQQLQRDKGTVLSDTVLYGSLQSIRELLTEKGSFATQDDIDDIDPNAATKRGIPYYQMALDSLAYEFATQMNNLNTYQNGKDGVKLQSPTSGTLFSMGSNTDDAVTVDGSGAVIAHITAANISVSKKWANNEVQIQTTDDPNAASGDTSRLAEFLALFDKKLEFNPKDIDKAAAGAAYKGTFEDMLLNIESTLAKDQMSTDAVLNNYVIAANDAYVSREGVTGVDLNDEATSLITYQKAYTAACRLLTTLEEALDSLINATM